MRKTWILALGLLVGSAMNLQAEDTRIFASADGKDSIRVIDDSEIDVRRNGADYTLAGYYLALDSGELRVTVTENGRDEVIYYTITEKGLTTATGKLLAPQEPKEMADSPARTKAMRVNSAGNMKQLGLAMLMYCGDNQGWFPRSEGAAGLEILNKEDILTAGKVYINPRDTRKAPQGTITEATTSYAYIGAGLKDDNDHATGVPILVEKPTNDDWVNFLFIDGHAEGMATDAKSIEGAVKAFYGKNGKYVPKDVQEDMLKRARKADEASK